METNSHVVIHEVYGHGMNYPQHTTAVSSDQSIMHETAGNTPDFTSADIKGSYIVGEEKYLGMENHDDIMALDFLDEP